MQISSAVRVTRPGKESGRIVFKWHSANALWDTGAAVSAISRELAGRLGLQIRERAVLATAAGRVPTIKDIVLLDLLLDNTVIPVMAAVVDAIPGTGNDFLIGMDVIQCGDFSLSTDHANHEFKVSFTPYPGIFRPIDNLFGK